MNDNMNINAPEQKENPVSVGKLLMRDYVKDNFRYLTGIAIVFLVISLLGSGFVFSAEQSLAERKNEIDSLGDGGGALAIFILGPVYLIEALVYAFTRFLFLDFPLASGASILGCALISRNLFAPEKGRFFGYKFFMGFGYTIAVIAALPYAFLIALILPVFGLIISIIGFAYYIKFCSKGLELTSVITTDKLSHFSELPYSLNTPALLCDTDFIIHTTNSFADQYYKTYYAPELKGLNICNFLTDEECAKLRSSAQLIKDNHSLERFVLSHSETDNFNLLLTAVRAKNKKLVGFLIKHE